jgi:hypothetical protein
VQGHARTQYAHRLPARPSESSPLPDCPTGSPKSSALPGADAFTLTLPYRLAIPTVRVARRAL